MSLCNSARWEAHGMLGRFSAVSTYMRQTGVFSPPTAVQTRLSGFDHPFFALFFSLFLTPHFCSPAQRTHTEKKKKKLVYICSNRMFADLPSVSHVCKQPSRDTPTEAQTRIFIQSTTPAKQHYL